MDKFKNEREGFAKLAATRESEALIGIFDGMNRMKKHSSSAEPVSVKRVAVMGAGLMGAGIAQVTAEKGYDVLLKDRDDVSLGRGVSYMTDNWDKKVGRRRMTKYQRNLNASRVAPLSDGTESWKRHFAGADLVIEAVFENLDLKRKIIQQVEDVTPDHTVFATNTSAIPPSLTSPRRRRESWTGPRTSWGCTTSRRCRRCRCWRSSPTRARPRRHWRPRSRSGTGRARRAWW